MYKGKEIKDTQIDLLIYDWDVFIYKACFAGERRSIKVIHKESGWEGFFNNRTEFWGRKKKSIEGFLGERVKLAIEKGREPPKKEDFIIEDIQEPEPLSFVLGNLKKTIDRMGETLGCTSYTGYYGKGTSFREDLSNVWKYKGNRDNVLKPILKDEVAEYLRKYHGAIPCIGLEADDWCVIRGIQEKNSVVLTNDKDGMGCPIWVYNPDKPELGIVNGDCFGEVIMVNDECRGYGRLFKYSQVIGSDSADNYKVNSASDIDFGEMSTYNALKDCKNDREAWEAMWRVFNYLYPEPKTIIGWRGDEIEVTALTMFQEQWDMAHMYRKEDDRVFVKNVLEHYGII